LILFGTKWIEAIPLLQVLGINGVLTVLLSSAHHVNMAVGRTRSSSLVLVAHSAITIPLMLWFVPRHGAQGAVVAMLIASILTAPLNYYLVGKAIDFGWLELKGILWRPLAGVVVMCGALWALRRHWPVPAGTAQLLGYAASACAVGAVAYCLTVYLLWQRRSDPESAEAWVLDRAAGFVRAVRWRIGTS